MSNVCKERPPARNTRICQSRPGYRPRVFRQQRMCTPMSTPGLFPSNSNDIALSLKGHGREAVHLVVTQSAVLQSTFLRNLGVLPPKITTAKPRPCTGPVLQGAPFRSQAQGVPRPSKGWAKHESATSRGWRTA